MDFLFAAKGTLSEDTIRLFLRQLGKKINYVIIDTQNDGHQMLSQQQWLTSERGMQCKNTWCHSGRHFLDNKQASIFLEEALQNFPMCEYEMPHPRSSSA